MHSDWLLMVVMGCEKNPTRAVVGRKIVEIKQKKRQCEIVIVTKLDPKNGLYRKVCNIVKEKY